MKVKRAFCAAYEGENNCRALEIEVEDRLSDYDVYLTFLVPDGTVFMTPDPIALEDGVATYILGADLQRRNGYIESQAVAINSAHIVEKSAIFKFFVSPSIDDSEAITPSGDLITLVDVNNRVTELDESIDGRISDYLAENIDSLIEDYLSRHPISGIKEAIIPFISPVSSETIAKLEELTAAYDDGKIYEYCVSISLSDGERIKAESYKRDIEADMFYVYFSDFSPVSENLLYSLSFNNVNKTATIKREYITIYYEIDKRHLVDGTISDEATCEALYSIYSALLDVSTLGGLRINAYIKEIFSTTRRYKCETMLTFDAHGDAILTLSTGDAAVGEVYTFHFVGNPSNKEIVLTTSSRGIDTVFSPTSANLVESSAIATWSDARYQIKLSSYTMTPGFTESIKSRVNNFDSLTESEKQHAAMTLAYPYLQGTYYRMCSWVRHSQNHYTFSFGGNGKIYDLDVTVNASEGEGVTLTERTLLPVRQSVTLDAEDWTDGEQTVSVTGILADETAQLITPVPASASRDEYVSSGVFCSAQAANSLTFTCETVPTGDLTVYVTVQEVSA